MCMINLTIAYYALINYFIFRPRFPKVYKGVYNQSQLFQHSDCVMYTYSRTLY